MIPPDDGSSSGGEPSSSPGSQTDTSREADVHAFLIADVRGYTAFTQERGDEDAARLAGRFAHVTRSVVEDHRGHVLELRGDEALVVFGSPRSAIRGAVGLQQRFVEETIADPSLPLTVGIGLDAGEAVAVEGGYRGGALNVAARLCSLAKSGEVLASREIVHLALRVDGIRFTERGEARLKGLDKPVHVVAVRSEERDDALAIAPFVRSTAPAPRRRWKAVAAVVALAVVAALIAVPIVGRDTDASSEIAPNSVGILDLESGEVTGAVELEDRPGSVAVSAESVWVTNPDVGTVTRIDQDEQQVRDTIQVGEDPTGIAAAFDAVWVVESGGRSVSRISPGTGQVVKTIPVGNGPAGIAVGEGAVWVTNRFDGTVSRIDPSTDEVEEIPVGLDPRGIAVGFGAVWVSLTGSNQVVRVDPETSTVTLSVGVGNAPGSLAVGAEVVWVVNTGDDNISAINPDTGSVKDTIPVGDGPAGISVVQGTVWVGNEWDGTLSRIEPDQASASPLVIGSVPQGLAVVGGDLWVSVRGAATSHRGGTLRLVSDEGPPSLDPPVGYESFAWPVLHLLGDGLVAFEPIGGTNPRLVADLATTVPAPTDGGKAYTFTLRPGIPYSTGKVVAPSDFREAFERGFRLNPDDVGYFYGGLVGGDACNEEPDTCDLSDGIVTDNATGTITFNLVEPDPEFLYKLTMPFAYPVPPSVPDDEQRTQGVPGTGPYMLDGPMTTEAVALKRNPQFHVWSKAARPDGYADHIEWTFNIEGDTQVEAVAAGDADLALGASDSNQLDDLFVRSAAQIHTYPTYQTYFLVLNIEKPPFDNVDVRRAINLAIDRDQVVRIFGGKKATRPACQTLPSNFPGYEPYCPYTSNPGPGGAGSWSGADIEEARRIVRRSGTEGRTVTFSYMPHYVPVAGPRLGDYLVDLLKAFGYRVRMKPTPVPVFYDPDTDFDMALGAWSPDYPAASNLIAPLYTCDAPIPPMSGFCDPAIDAMIERATQLQLDEPAAAGALWAQIDREIVGQAPYVWLHNPIVIDFVSERVGNYQSTLQWGALLDQLWVR
jgi:YVTN family beta-propeller protein